MRSRAFLLLGSLLAAGAARAELVDRIVAVVDRDVVTLSEAEQSRAVVRARSGEEPLLATVVERLIEARLVEREVERLSAKTPPGDLLAAALEDLRKTFPSEAAFREALVASGISEEELRAQVARQARVAAYLEQRFRPLTFVTEEQIEAYYRDELPPASGGAERPELASVSESIRRILEERAFNARVSEWIDDLKERARIRRYVW
jgi:peptidyl-prolyl cis-trans isomerase SurA